MRIRISAASKPPETFDRKGVETHMKRCVHTRHRLASCSRCVQACPVGALSLAGTISVATEKCTGCGVCTTVCPSGACEAVSPTVAELCRLTEEQARRSKKVVFRCENHAGRTSDKPEDVIDVPCIGRIDECILLAAAAAGAETVRLLDGGCERCERRRGSDVAICAAHQVNLLLENLDVSSRLLIESLPSSGATLRKVQGSHPGGMSRRDFFSILWRMRERANSEESQRRACSQRASLEEDVKYVPAKWPILSKAIKDLGAASHRSMLSGDLWAEIAMDGHCNGCLVCASSCPTGALTRVEEDGKVGLSFTAARCTACGLCTEVCCWNCLSVKPFVDNTRVINGEAKSLIFHRREAVELLTASMEEKVLTLLGMNGVR